MNAGPLNAEDDEIYSPVTKKKIDDCIDNVNLGLIFRR